MDKNTRINLIDEIMNIKAFAYGLDHLNGSEVYIVNFKPRKEGLYYDVIFECPEEGVTVRYSRKFMAKDRVQEILDYYQKRLKTNLL